jgi:hypothetical protein
MDLARAPRRAARKKGSGYENGFCYQFIFVYGFLILLSNQVRSFELNVRNSLLNSQFIQM